MPDLPAASAAAAPAPDKGPYTSNRTQTIKISGPIEITITTRVDSSHVPPPPPWGAGRSGQDAVLQAIQPFAEAILTKLEDIRQAQEPSL